MDKANDIEAAIVLLEKAYNDLRSDAYAFYDAGDNYRGNIRYDGSADVLRKIVALKTTFAYLSKALVK